MRARGGGHAKSLLVTAIAWGGAERVLRVEGGQPEEAAVGSVWRSPSVAKWREEAQGIAGDLGGFAVGGLFAL